MQKNSSIPEEKASDLASERDREWFERHPDRNYRIRFLMPGEMPGLETDPSIYAFVAVGQALPGRRIRVPFTSSVIGSFDEATARSIFDGLAPAGILDAMRAGAAR